MAIKYYDEKNTNKERRRNPPSYQKTVDKSYSPRYNEDRRANTYDVNDVWKKFNEKALRYAGDSAKESVGKGLKEVSKFMKDAPEGTDYGKVQSAAVKWRLANDANNKGLIESAWNELIGHLSAENKETYLKKARPLQEFVDAKDTFDYKNKNYTTTKNSTKRFDEAVQRLQRMLNEKGYTDKFGQKLKEDGIYGAKTRFAEDSFEKNNLAYQVEYPLYYPEKHDLKMLDDSEIKLAPSDYTAQLVNYKNFDNDRIGEGIWSLKNDDYGLLILSHWLYGDGKECVVNSPEWGRYMKNNKTLTSKVKDIVIPLADGLENNQSKNVDLTTSMVIENGEDIIGYQYLHGTNADVGGFQIKGTVSKNSDGDVTYDLTYIWNDKIDPNFIYESDSKKAEFAKSIPFADPKDYIIRIKWSDKTIIKANPSWYNWNFGWLK